MKRPLDHSDFELPPTKRFHETSQNGYSPDSGHQVAIGKPFLTIYPFNYNFPVFRRPDDEISQSFPTSSIAVTDDIVRLVETRFLSNLHRTAIRNRLSLLRSSSMPALHSRMRELQ